jgi:hypothetical protein
MKRGYSVPETPAAPKRTRGKRRNFAKEITDLKAYCESYIQVLQEEHSPSEEKDYHAGKIIAFKQVLAKIGAPKS